MGVGVYEASMVYGGGGGGGRGGRVRGGCGGREHCRGVCCEDMIAELKGYIYTKRGGGWDGQGNWPSSEFRLISLLRGEQCKMTVVIRNDQ